MQLRLGDTVPDFTAQTTMGPISFHQWIGDEWCMLFSHPKDFTPICTTELGSVARLMPEFEERGVRVIGLSVDDIETHKRWMEDIEETQMVALNYPLIADPNLNIAKMFGMLPADTSGGSADRTAMDNHTTRSVYFIAPDKTVKSMITYPMSTGRNFREVLRVIDSLQLTAKHTVGTPADWDNGEDVVILTSLSDEAAAKAFPDGWTAPKPYLRMVPQPA